MRRLTEKQIVALIGRAEAAAASADWMDGGAEKWRGPAVLRFPSGEIMNPGIAGFLWAWHMTGRLVMVPIEGNDRFNAQGLEGACQVETDLCTALLAARELPPYRRLVIVGEVP